MSDTTTKAIVIDSSGARRGADEVARAFEKVIAGNRALEAQQIRAVESSARQARQLDALARRLDPLGQAVREASRDIERLQRVSATSGENAERAASLMAAAERRLADARAVANSQVRAAETLSASYARQTGQTSMALRNLGIQSIDVFQQLASGAPVMMTLIQQGGQVGQMAAVTGTSLGSLARQAAGVVASYLPLIATLGGAAGLGAALFLVGKRSVDLEAQQRALSVAIKGVGRDAELSAGQLQGYVTAIKQQGVALEDAQKAVAELARNSSLSGGMIGRIVGLGPDAASALGVSTPEAMKLLAEAAKGTRESIEKLDDAFNLLTPTQAANVRTMLEHGDKAKALETVFDALDQRVRGLNDQSLSASERAFRNLGNAWDDFISRVANSDVVVGAIQRLTAAIGGLVNMMSPGRAATSLADIDALISAQTGNIPGMNATAARARREQAEALARLNAQRNDLAQQMADAAEFGYGIPPPSAPSLATPQAAVAREVDRLAASRVASGSGGQLATLRQEAARYREELARLVPGTDEYTARQGRLREALDATNKAIEDATKKGETHRATVEKTKDIIGDLIREAEQHTAAQQRIAEAYDGTERSITRAQDTEKAHAAALKANLKPGTVEYADAVERLNRAYTAGSEATQSFQQAQNSVRALFDTLSTAVDRVGQGLVDAFLSGGRAAINFGSIARAAIASVASDVFRMALINPIGNAVFGGSRPTLGSAVGVLGGGGGSGVFSGGGLLGNAQSLFSIGGFTDRLGLTNIGGFLGRNLGFGEGGFISGLLNTPLWGAVPGIEAASAANIAGAIGPGGLFSEAAAAGNMGISSPLGAPGTSLGGLLAGIGGGFALGSLGGGFLQSALGRTGPAPTIGSGLGAVAGTLAFGPLGGVIGGLLGGGLGGFIGPGKKNPFSATGLTVDDSGMLAVGRTFSQIVDTSQEVAQLGQAVSQLNSVLSAVGARIANGVSADEFGQQRLIGGGNGTWLNFGQGGGRPGTLEEAFRELRFTASDEFVRRGLEGRSFGSLEEFATAAQEIKTFVDQTAPALKQLGMGEASYGVGELATAIGNLTTQFDEAVKIADKLGWAEFDLTEARQKALQAANDNIFNRFNAINRSLVERQAAAIGVTSGDPRLQMDAALLTFDRETEDQRKAFREQLRAAYGDAFVETELYAEQIKLLEDTRGAERLAVAKGYLDAIANAESSRAGIIRSITDYVRGITFGPESPLPRREQYSSARTQFEAAASAARGGDTTALSRLTGLAETFRSASRQMFGSGANFVADFGQIISALQDIATVPAEQLTGGTFVAETRNQTNILASEIRSLKDELARIAVSIKNGASAPPSARAA